MMQQRLMPGTVLTAIILCLLAFSHASPIPLEQLIPQEDSPSFAVSTNLFIRDHSMIASRANEGESSMTHDLLRHRTASLLGNTESTKGASTSKLPSAKSAKIVLPPLRPPPLEPKTSAASVGFVLPASEPPPPQSIVSPPLRPPSQRKIPAPSVCFEYTQSSTQAVVVDVETPPETGIPPYLTGKQADLVLQVLDSTTADNKLPWNTQEPYRWSAQTKRNAIQFHRHGLPSDPEDENALNATMEELWVGILRDRRSSPIREKKAIDNGARNRLLRGDIDPSGHQTRSSLLVRAIEEGNEPWKTARNWEEAQREEKWGAQVWKWTEADLKEILAYVLVCKYDKKRVDLRGKMNDTWNQVVAMNFDDFKRTIESVWEWVLKLKKRRNENDAIYKKRRKLEDAGLARFVKYLLPEPKKSQG
ncbi:hypothetical protein H0H93_012069 [Arthromyces matolae]|nr:hypothetical protein H0H93_012069 [Arthromyces matolae]